MGIAYRAQRAAVIAVIVAVLLPFFHDHPLPPPLDKELPCIVLDTLMPAEDAVNVTRAARRFGMNNGYHRYAVEKSATSEEWGIPVDRYDIARHYMITGGRLSRREPFSSLSARLGYFRETFATGDRPADAPAGDRDAGGIRIIPAMNKAPGLEHLISLPQFYKGAAELYPNEDGSQPVVHPTIVYANMMLPGMELPLHTDVPEFRGANRRQVPQWLLVVMRNSGLFERYRLNIATAVSWWSESGGRFTYYPRGAAGNVSVHPTLRNSAVITDTDTLIHGVDRVDTPCPTCDWSLVETDPTLNLTFAPLSRDESTVFSPSSEWGVHAPNAPDPIFTTTWDSLRLSISWKAFVFKSEADRQVWLNREDDLDVSTILPTLVRDMVARGRLPLDAAAEPSRSLAEALMAEYIRLPPPTTPAIFPNYCLLPVLNFLCGAKSLHDTPLHHM